MLEWKILAAAFSALLVISMVLVGNSGVSDMFGGIIGKLTDWLGGTPVNLPGGIGKSSSMVSITLYPNNFTLNPDAKLNLTLGGSYFENFNGQVSFDFKANKIYLKEKGSSFTVSSPIQDFVMQDFRISRLQLSGMKFTVMSSQSNITNENGDLDIQGFQGMFSAANSSITLSGNVTKITGDGWSVG